MDAGQDVSLHQTEADKTLLGSSLEGVEHLLVCRRSVRTRRRFSLQNFSHLQHEHKTTNTQALETEGVTIINYLSWQL